eukprot:5232183-Pyramimonas_sp.AAC.1
MTDSCAWPGSLRAAARATARLVWGQKAKSISSTMTLSPVARRRGSCNAPRERRLATSTPSSAWLPPRGRARGAAAGRRQRGGPW